jgi:hypothetical protein
VTNCVQRISSDSKGLGENVLDNATRDNLIRQALRILSKEYSFSTTRWFILNVVDINSNPFHSSYLKKNATLPKSASYPHPNPKQKNMNINALSKNPSNHPSNAHTPPNHPPHTNLSSTPFPRINQSTSTNCTFRPNHSFHRHTLLR